MVLVAQGDLRPHLVAAYSSAVHRGSVQKLGRSIQKQGPRTSLRPLKSTAAFSHDITCSPSVTSALPRVTVATWPDHVQHTLAGSGSEWGEADVDCAVSNAVHDHVDRGLHLQSQCPVSGPRASAVSHLNLITCNRRPT
eukprot:461125-Rhodomonas_salina.4